MNARLMILATMLLALTGCIVYPQFAMEPEVTIHHMESDRVTLIGEYHIYGERYWGIESYPQVPSDLSDYRALLKDKANVYCSTHDKTATYHEGPLVLQEGDINNGYIKREEWVYRCMDDD